MPAERVFIDSNTFLYTFDELEEQKRVAAQDWLLSLTMDDCGVTSLQALNEVASVATRKSKRFSQTDLFSRIDAFAAFGSHPVAWATSLVARVLFETYRYSWWDSLLLASALELGCTHFLSEDLQDGQSIQGLTIVDPFAHSPEQILISR